jgi:hypothetical protein
VRTPHGKVFFLKDGTCDLAWLNQKIGELVQLALDQDADGIKSKLKEISPEYQPYQPLATFEIVDFRLKISNYRILKS